MYCRNYTGTVSRVLCREVYYTVSFVERFIILCHLGESIVRGFATCIWL